MQLYGIANCNTVKKARSWLDEQGLTYTFIDFKKQAPDTALLQEWINKLGWQPLINRQGTTWRQLDTKTQAGITDAASAIALMLAKPSVIKRPVWVNGDQVTVGFSPEHYASLLRPASE